MLRRDDVQPPQIEKATPMENARNFYINGKWTAPMGGHDFDVVDASTE